jgi:NitT/TauT family transport system ATP-binding protein
MKDQTMTHTGHPALEISAVSRSYTRRDGKAVRALSNVSVSIAEGEFVCIVGPSGCGKSTLLQICAGLDKPTSGSIRARGAEIAGPGPDRGVVFQKDSVFPWMSVLQNVEYGLKCRGVAPSNRREAALHYLSRVGLGDVVQAWPRELSGGMLKRVAIASVFANGSEILLLDEPFGALDYVTRHKIHDVLIELWGEVDRRKRTVLFVTHDVDEALTLADRILVMRAGQVVDDFQVESARPRDEEALSAPETLVLKRRLLDHLGIGHAPRPLLAAGAVA